MAALQVGCSIATGVPDPANTLFPDHELNIDPHLLAKQCDADTWNSERGSGDEYSSDGYHDGNEEDDFNESDEEHAHTPQHGSTGLI